MSARRTITAALVAAALVLSVFQVSAGGAQEGGSAEPAATSGPITLTISIGSHGRFLIEDTVKDFTVSNPNVQVEIVAVSSVPNEAFQTFSTMFTAQDDSLDIIGIDPSWPYHMARAGWIAELAPLYQSGDQQDLQDFNQAVLNTNLIAGKLYALPLYADALMLYYRKDLLDRYGFQAPVTWDELQKQTRTVLDRENDPNLSGYIYQARKIEGLTCNFVNFLSGVDGEILDSSGKVVMDDQKGRQALDFMVTLVDQGLSPKSIVTHNPNDDRIQFENGQAVFMNNWVFAMDSYTKPESGVYGKTAITRMVGKGQPGESCLGAVSIAINNYSGHKEASWEFVKFLTGPKWNKERAIRAGLWPARESVWDDPEVLEAKPSFGEVRKGASNLVARPTTRTQYYLRISDEIQLYLNQALSGMIGPQEALSKAAASIRTILKQ